MRRTTAVLLILLGLIGNGYATAAASTVPGDLKIKSANPDGTLNCAKWCSATEVCC
jgi:hypothetical protein